MWRGTVQKNGKGDSFNVKPSSRAKPRCQLIIREKAIKYKEEIFRYLSSYIHLLSWIQLVPTLWSVFQTANIGALMPELCVGVIGNVTSCRDAEAFGLIVFMLRSIFCFRYDFHYLLFEVWAVHDVIHHLNHAPTSNYPSGSICVTC